MAQAVKSITSESLEAFYRSLTPSQQGFTQDLMASNVIIPTVDLTSAAEGSSVPEYLQTAIAFGSQTAISSYGNTVTVANTAGFYQLIGGIGLDSNAGSNFGYDVDITDGLTSKTIFGFRIQPNTASDNAFAVQPKLTFFLRSGDTCSLTTTTFCRFTGSVRQVADVNGVLVNPVGFTPQ